MRISLSDHFTYGRLLRFALPSIAMMIFTSIYSVVDGLFVANLVGSNALASINLVIPLGIIVGAVGFMLGTGGSAEVSRTLGQGERENANRYFSMLIIAIVVSGVVLSALGIAFIRPLCRFLGATDLLMEDSVTYGTVILLGCTFFMLQTTFQTFFVTAEKPHLGFALTAASGLTNMVLDYLFIKVLGWGIAGAAWATVCGYCVGGLVPLVYFLLPNTSLLRLCRTRLYPSVLLHSCSNGASEMLSNLSMSVITFLYNWQMLRLAGEDGVAAVTVIMYVNFIFVAILIGFSMGTAPVIGYHFGAENIRELQSLFRKCLTVICTMSGLMFLAAETTANVSVSLFLEKGTHLYTVTVTGFRMYSAAFLLCGLNIFASSFFTALCNGKISALISTLRSLVLEGGMLLLLPALFGTTGVFLAVPAAEALTATVSVMLLLSQREQYHYA